MKKIGLCGVHGSGKTTLATAMEKNYAARGCSVYVISEVARNVPYPLGTVEAQEYIWRNQMIQEKHAMGLDLDVLICDRTVMDNLMYYRHIIEKSDQLSMWREHFFRWLDLHAEAEEWMATYDQVIRLPLNLEWLQKDDPLRPKSVSFARQIDRLFDVFVQKYVTVGL